jgi:ParB-like nuclease domain
VTQDLVVSDRVGPAKRLRGYRAGLRRRVRRVQREARRAPGRVTQMLHKLPISPHIRHELARVVLWSPGSSQIAIDDALLGGQNGLSAAEYAAATGDLFWPSRRVVDGPHSDLLRRSRNAGELSDEEILDSPYGQMAARCIDMSGQYFSATDAAGIVEIARDFIDRTFSDDPGVTTTRARQSRAGTPILVAPIAHSDLYQVVDGHHRIASLAIQGRETFPARVRRSRVRTPVQELLEEMSWIGGNQELYQPIDAPELERDWATVRRCTDRLGAMDQVTARLGIEPDTSSYLDVASCYGWFVAEMRDRGFDAYGIERDPLAPSLGVGAYGLDPSRIFVGDAVELLRADKKRYDVVSCFSLLHHFVLGRGSTDAEGLLELLDQATGRVLFLDTGQANEAWFKESLPEWDPQFIAKFLEKNSTFDEIIDWGPDADAVPPYEDNYGRHLFACMRMSI